MLMIWSSGLNALGWKKIRGIEVAQVHGLHAQFLPDLTLKPLQGAFPRYETAARELGIALPADQLVGQQELALVDQQAVHPYVEPFYAHDLRIALNMCRLPGGPCSRSTCRPAACIALRTSPFAQ